MRRCASVSSTGANVEGDADTGYASEDSGYGTDTESNSLDRSENGLTQYPSEDGLTRYYQRVRNRRGEIAPQSTFPIHERASQHSMTPSALSPPYLRLQPHFHPAYSLSANVSLASRDVVDPLATASAFGEDGQPSRDRPSSFSKSGAAIISKKE